MNFPSQYELATLAAAMSSPTEDPDVTATRAIALWDACDRKLSRLESLGPLQEKVRAEEKKFLKACGVGGILQLIALHDNDHVPLAKFLAACKPSPNSKTADIQKKWRDYRSSMIEKVSLRSGLTSMTSTDLLDATEAQMKRDREQGISCTNLLGLRQDFEEFIRRTRKVTLSQRGKMGGRPKSKTAEKSHKATTAKKAPPLKKNH
jgi:hypothetical protein